MAKKKNKSVLDYDPLAWLNESEDAVVESEDKVEPKKSKPKKTAKKAVKKKAVKKKAVKKNVTIETTSINAISDEEGFGFFADEVEPVKGDSSEENDGFGFFEQNNNVTSKEVKEAEEGFGFFEENVNNSMIAEKEDEGFGFFTDDGQDAVEVVNMETLDITKEDAINLGSELTIKTVTEVKEKITTLLSADEDIVVNAEEMIKIDTAGLQLLYSLKETLSQTGHHIKWIGTSSVINDSAEMIGMPVLAPKSKEACFGFFEENMPPKDAEDGSSGFF